MFGVKREPEEDFTSDTFTEFKRIRTEISDSSSGSEEKVKAVFLLSYVGNSCFSFIKKASRGHNQSSKIEKTFINALFKAEVISYQEFSNTKLIDFKTAVYTRQKMPAARNFVSMLIPLKHISENAIQKINSFLPREIRLCGIKRATMKFDPTNEVTARTYSYMLPTYALAATADECRREYRISENRLQVVRESLEKYAKDMNFYCFIPLRLNKDIPGEIESCACSPPFELYGIEFCLIKIKIHCISNEDVLSLMRQAVGLFIASLRKITSIKKCIEGNLYIPGVPKNYLMFEEPHFDRYNEKMRGSQELEPLEWGEFDERVERFRRDQLTYAMAETERTEKHMLIWLESLNKNMFYSKDE